MVKYVLITGGDRGIGRATALRFAREGFNVCFTYNRRREEAERTAEEIRRFGVEAIYTSMDVGDTESVRKAYEFFNSKVPYFNVLVNNAGIISFSKLDELSPEEWERVIRVNLTGVYLVTKAFLPLLRKARQAS
jgi:3-oxoacyl-[acyl-carrier protein] reductase